MLIISEKTDKILPALVKVKATVKALVKKTNNPFFKSKFADLNTHLDEVEPLLEENGLVLLQPPVVENGNNTVTTMIFHGESGQYFGASILIPPGLDAQKTGASITYFRRFGLNALLALKSIDDDGNTATGKVTEKSSKTKEDPVVTTEVKSTLVTTNTDRPSFRRPKAATVTAPITKETALQDDI